MNVLLIGGTGLISTGIVKHLLTRGAMVTMLNRGRREDRVDSSVRRIVGDRNDAAFLEATAKQGGFDVVIDMVCFAPSQAAGAITAFAGRCEQFIFCSTVCTYGVKVPPRILIDESFPQEPISNYGRDKLACERLFLDAHASGKFNATIIRPSCTYGPGNPLVDNLEFNPVAWDRIERDQPILCSGDGLGLWQATHRDDVGKLFAHACLRSVTYGQAYNATRDTVFTWRDYYQQAATAMGKRAKAIFMPAEWIVAHDPQRFVGLKEIFGFHGAYTSAKARRDVPEFTCKIDFVTGAADTFADVRRRNAWRDSQGDAVYDAMVAKALGIGVPAEPI